MKKRMLALLLALVAVLGMLPVNAFAEEPSSFAVTVKDSLYGSVTADKAEAAEGETVTLTVKAEKYYALDTLTVTDAEGTPIAVAEDSTFQMPASAVTVEASFKQTSGMKQYFKVTVDGVEYPGQYIGTQAYDEKGRKEEAFLVKLPEGSTKMTVTAIDEMCYVKELYVLNMENMSIRYDAMSHELPLTGSVTTYKLNAYLENNRDPSYCYLRVELPTYNVNLDVGANGSVTVDKEQASLGETVQMKIKIKKGYMLDALTVTDANGNPVAVTEDNTFVMPGCAVKIKATFKEIPPVTYKVTVLPSENGTVSADKTEAVQNDTVKLTITPAEGYSLKSLSVRTISGAEIEVAEDYTFTMPGSDVEISAAFKSGITSKVNIKIEGYEIGKTGKFAQFKMYDKDGKDFTDSFDDWYICLQADTADVWSDFGELKANTRYWLRIEKMTSGYQPSDFTLMDMDTGSVTDKSGYGNFLIFMELPVLEEPASAFAIDTSKVTDGTVRVKVAGKEVTEATAGSTVTLVAAPAEGYSLEGMRVLDASGNVLSVTNTAEGTYIFVMPDSTVTVYPQFHQIVAEDMATVILSEVKDVLPGDKIIVPVTVTNPPAGNFSFFNLNVVLPEGWDIRGAEQGADSRLNSTDVWQPTPIVGGYGMAAAYDGSLGVRFPEGEVMKLVIHVPNTATPGTYKLDLVSAGLTLGWSESETSSFGQYIDGYVTVKAGAAEKIKLDAPVITDDMIIAYEDMVESRNIPASSQDANAVIEYRFTETEEELETAEWTLGGDPGLKHPTDSIRWIKQNLKDDTKYYLQVRYRAYNTEYFIDSDPVTMEVTTKAWVKEPVKISTTDAIARPGDTFTVEMYFDHELDNRYFVNKDYSFSFNQEYFTLVSRSGPATKAGYLPEGKVATLTFAVKEDVAPGEYALDLTGANFELYYNRASNESTYWVHNRFYPVNHTFTSGTVTVVPRLSTPVLKDYTATDDSITVEPPAAVENAKVEYAISEKENEKEFTWQDSNVFTGLKEKRTYYIYARNIAIDKTKNGDSVISEPLKVVTVNPAATYTVASVEGFAGQTVEVSITLEHSIAKKADSFVIVPMANENLNLVGIKAGKDLDEEWFVYMDEEEGIITAYRDDAAVIPSGEVIVLTYAILKDAEGDLEVSLNAFGDDGCTFYDGEDLLRVEGTVIAGKITVTDAHYGDVNDDGLVNGKDLVALGRHMAEWPDYAADKLNMTAADVNADGEVNGKDVLVLSRHMAEWPEYKNLPYNKG